MAKSKNHTNHNQSKKNHKNGIKKPKYCKYFSQRGTWLPLKQNTTFSVKHNKGAIAQKALRAKAGQPKTAAPAAKAAVKK